MDPSEDFVLFESQSESSQRMYDKRASTYDDSWHPEFARKVVHMADLQPGHRVLDLACGTGLCTVAAVEAVGPTGFVLGIDITYGMLSKAQRKIDDLRQSLGSNLPQIKLIQHDICELDTLSDLQGLQGTFDAITVASALVLFNDPAELLQHWIQYLKPLTGKLVVDVPHPMNQPGGRVFERAANRCGIYVPFHREWVTSEDAWRQMLEDVRSSDDGEPMLIVERIVLQEQAWFGRRFYGVYDGENIFNDLLGILASQNLDTISSEKRDQLKSVFLDEWQRAAGPSGVEEVDGAWIAVARRR